MKGRKVKISPELNQIQSVSFQGKGLPRYGGYGRGDELVRINVKVPTKINDAQKALLKELDRELRISGD